MPVKTNRFYNDPALGAAFTNIAAMFGPPDAQDTAAYAQAAATRNKDSRIAQLFADPNQPDFDRRNIAIGNYAPTQSFYAQDQNNNTARRGQDLTASTSITNNEADNVRALATNELDNRTSLLTKMFDPLAQGEIRPALPESIAEMYGVPALPQVAGAAKPLSLTEQQAVERKRLIASGDLSMEDVLAAINSDIPVENVIGADGKPTIARRSDAVGQTPAAKGSEAPTGYRFAADGRSLEFIPHGPADPATAGKTTEATRRNQQLASVITPELQTLIGDGTPENPGTFDALSNGYDQAYGGVPMGNNFGINPSAEYQQAANSLKTIVASYLYSVSGATANPGEVENQIAVLTPRRGDSAKAIADKKARLVQMVKAVQSAATGAPFDMSTVDAAPAETPAAAEVPPPAPGDIVEGHRFVGGDPADPANWVAVGGGV